MTVIVSSLPTTKPPVEHRKQRRRRVLLSGLGVVSQTHTTFDCSIRDLSETGARVDVRAGALIPTTFLLINIKAGMAHEVQVVWRRERELGIRILRPILLAGATSAEARQLRRIMVERLNR